MSIVSESEFKGNRMIVIKNNEDDQYPFQFGVKKQSWFWKTLKRLRNLLKSTTNSKSALFCLHIGVR